MLYWAFSWVAGGHFQNECCPNLARFSNTGLVDEVESMAHSSNVERLQFCIEVQPLILIYKEFRSFGAVGFHKAFVLGAILEHTNADTAFKLGTLTSISKVRINRMQRNMKF